MEIVQNIRLVGTSEYLASLSKEVFLASHSTCPEENLRAIIAREEKAIAAILAIHKLKWQNRIMLQAHFNASGKPPDTFGMRLVEKEIREIVEIAREFGFKLPSLDILDSEVASHSL